MASEKDDALAAVPSDSPTIFDKIINKEIPANVVFEDDKPKDMGIHALIGLCPDCVECHVPYVQGLMQKYYHWKQSLYSYGVEVLAFRDIAPQAPTHILLIPKVKDGLTGLSKAEERHSEILGRLLYTAKVVAKQEGLEEGFRIVINDGPNGGQSVDHIHVHVLGGRQMNWPPG